MSIAASEVSGEKAPQPPVGVLPPLRRGYRINDRLLLLTLVLVALVAVLGYFSRRYFMARNASIYLTSAQKAEAEGNLVKALGYYRQYLRLSALRAREGSEAAIHRADILVKTGELQEKLVLEPGENRSVVLLYEEAARLNPQSPTPRRKLISLLTRIGRYTDALQHIQLLERTTSDPAKLAELAYRAGVCHELLNDFSQAQARYCQSLELLPQQFLSYLALVRLWSTKPSLERLSVRTERSSNWPELASLQSTHQRGDPLPTFAAILVLLERMVAAQPGYEAELVRAQALSRLQLSLEVSPVSPEFARQRVAGDILPNTDSDADGQLTGDERWASKVPALSDADKNGVITQEELITRLSVGDRQARLQEAERELVRLIEHEPVEHPRWRVEAQLTLIQLLLDQLNSGVSQSADQRQALRARVRQIAQSHMQSPQADPRFRLTLVQLALQELTAVTDSDELLKTLDEAETLLQDGLAEVAQMEPLLEPADEWQTLWAPLDPFLLEVELEYHLARLWLLRVALLEHEPSTAETLLARAQTLIEKLKQRQLETQSVTLLEFRLAWLREHRAHGEEKVQIRQQQVLPLAVRLAQGVGRAGSPSAREAAGLLGTAYLRLNNPGAALDIYRRQTKADPFWVEGRLAVAEILTRLGRTEDAIAEYQAVLSAPGAAENLVKLLLLRQMQRLPEERDWTGVEFAVGIAEQTARNRLAVQALRSEFLGLRALTGFQLAEIRKDPSLRNMAQGLLTDEEQRLRTLLRDHPEAVELWASLAMIYLRRFDLSLAERHEALQTLLREARQHTGPRLELAQVELLRTLQQPPEVARQGLDQLAAELETLPEQGRTSLTLALVDAYQQLNSLPQALQFLQQQAERRPDELDLQVRLLQLMLLVGDPTDPGWEQRWMETLARVEALEGTPDATSAVFRAQRLLADRRGDPAQRSAQLQKARELLQTAAKARPYVAAIPRNLGLLEEEAGNLNAAVEAYLRAVELGDVSQLVVSRLVNLYFTRHTQDRDKYQVDMEAAHRLLERVAALRPQVISGELARLAWQVELNRGQIERAAVIAAQVASQSQDPRDIVADLAFEYQRGEQSDEMLQKFQDAAYHRAPQSGLTWLMLLRYLIRARDWTTAEKTIRDAESILTTERSPSTLLAVATLWETLANTEGPEQDRWQQEATKRYDTALIEFPHDVLVRVQALDHFLQRGINDRAQNLIAYLLDPARSIPADVRALARRRQAVLDARSGSYGDTLKAILALQRARQAGTDLSFENLRLQLRLLQRLREIDTSREQKPLLLELEQQGKLTRDEQLQLAQVLLNLGEWDAAEQRFRKVCTTYPQYVTGRLAYATALLKRSATEPQLLETTAEQLRLVKSLEPQSFRTIALEARWLAAQGKLSEATMLVQSMVASRLAVQGDRRFQVLIEQENVGELFETLAASEAFRQRRDILEALQSALALIRRGQTEQAARHLAAGPAAPLLDEQLRDINLQAGLLVEEWDVPQAETYFRAALTQHPSRRTAFELSRLLANQGRVEEALAVCEEQWDRMTPSGVAIVLSLLSRRKEPQLAEQLAAWEQRVQAAAAELPPGERSNLHLHLGHYANELGRYDMALGHYRVAQSLDQRRYVPLNNFAFLCARLNQDLDEAEKAIETALELAGPRTELVDTKAAVLLARNRVTEAREYLQGFTTQYPHPITLFRLAECYLRLNDLPAARSTLQQALQLGLKPESLHPLDRSLFTDMQKLLP